MSTLPSTGLHPNVSFEDYRSWDAVNYSTLKHMAKSPLHCKYEADHPKPPTPAQIKGSALHISTFEPGRFKDEFFLAPDTDRKTAKWKEEQQAAAGDKTILYFDDSGIVSEMAKAIREFPKAAHLINAPGECELSGLWQDPLTGIMCKMRLDKWSAQQGIITELKSTEDASLTGFFYHARKYKYFAQAAYYCWGIEMITGKAPLHAFIAVENEPPFAVATHMAGDLEFADGAAQFRKWLDEYATCKKANAWPGYPNKFQILTRPIWEN